MSLLEIIPGERERCSRPSAMSLRARLLSAGYTVRRFARAHGYNERTVKAAMRGERFGPECRRILNQILNFRANRPAA